MAARSGATVELREVTKRYGDTVAVDHLSLTAPAGRITVLIGPSGCGKTTSLRMVNRLIEPTSGEILIDGQNILQEDPTQLRRRIGYVIQQVGLFPHRTIGENVATVPELLGWTAARIRARVDELLSLIGFDPARMRDRYPAQLSGGERQRVGVARAMAAEPPLMLMDEPFGAVDPIVRNRLQDEFLNLQRTLGITVIFVTHDVDEAIKLGDRVAVMRTGKLVQYSPPAELLAHPADDFVAQFVGHDRALKRLGLLTVGGIELDRTIDRSRLGAAPTLSPSTSVRDALAALLVADARAAGVRGILSTTPCRALFAFLVPYPGLSVLTAEIGLVSYTLLILIRNIVSGIRSVPSDVRDAAQGMGYTPRQILWRIELPLALAVIFAG